ncbi:MAG: tetratricopeptide repeat protein, partial [Cyanobacteria bacterium P01_D01_bin.36]
HAQNIIHRDLKPDNIILRQSDQLPCLIDFGAVKELMNTVVVPSESQASSVVIGTLGFMAPEQAVGRPVFSSDLYSLGMTAIYLLTARSPLEMPTDSMNGRLLWNQFAPNINPRLAGILTRAIHPYPPTRFASATDMLAVLTEQPSPPKPYVASTAISVPDSVAVGNAAASGATQIGSPATQIGSSVPQSGSPATQVGSFATQIGGFAPQFASAEPQPAAANGSVPANKYYSLNPSVQKKKEINSLFVKAGGAVAATLLMGSAFFFGYRSLSSSAFASSAIDASSPEKLEQSIAKLEKTVDARPSDTDAQLELISGYAHGGRYEALVSQVEVLLENTDDDEITAQALYWKGSVQIAQGDYDAALETLAEAVEKDDTNAFALNSLGRVYQDTGRYEDAIAQFQAAIAADPSFASAYVNQSSVKELQGDLDAAEGLLEAALPEVDDSEEISFYRLRGNLRANLEEIEKAEADWEKVVSLSAQSASDYSSQGFSQGLLGNAEDSIDNFEQALAINPKSVDAYISRSIIHLREGDLDAASADVDSAIAINPNAMAAYQLMANIEVAREEPDMEVAIAATTKGLDVNPNHPNLLSDRCSGYLLSSQLDNAIADCTKSIDINPNLVATYYTRGQAYFTQKNYESAEKDFTSVIDLNEKNEKPQNATVYSSRALSRSELDDNAGAQADISEAIALDDDNPDYYKLRGMFRFLNEEFDASIPDFKKAEELYAAQGKEDEDLREIMGLLSQLGLL